MIENNYTEHQFRTSVLNYGVGWKFKQGPIVITSEEDCKTWDRVTHWIFGYSEMVAKKGVIKITYRRHFERKRGNSGIEWTEHNMGWDRKILFFTLQGAGLIGRDSKTLSKLEEWQFFRGVALFYPFFPAFDWLN